VRLRAAYQPPPVIGPSGAPCHGRAGAVPGAGMIERTHVSFGVKTSQMGLTYQEILAVWREADQIPMIEHAWLWDHMVPLRADARADALEAWTLLAALAAQTTRLRLGVIVTSNRLRPPAVLAKMAATTDIIAAGRLVFGAAGEKLALRVVAQHANIWNCRHSVRRPLLGRERSRSGGCRR
jgi:hypothetical protein